MNSKKLFSLGLIVTVFVTALSGCTEPEETNKKDISKPTSFNEKSEGVNDYIVKSIELLDAPVNLKTPSEVAMKQFKVDFENGKHAYLKKKDKIFETIVGNQAITAFHSPEGPHRYAIFSYRKQSDWIMDGLIRVGMDGPVFSDTKGLRLPKSLSRFGFENLTISDPKPKRGVWTFFNESKIVTIMKTDSFSFEANPDSKIIELKNGKTAHVFGDGRQTSLYYVDKNKVIILSGNIDDSEILSLANSLPSPNSPHFPSTVQEGKTTRKM